MNFGELPTLCAAFQRSVAAHPDAVAIRTPHDGVRITWGEYAHRVRRIAAGLAALGVRRGDTVGLMMVNRPEFHLCDTAVMHLGGVAFSVYNTSPVAQIEHVLAGAGNRVLICEQRFLDRLRQAGGEVRHVVCVDAEPEGTISLAALQELGDPAFDFDAAWRAVTPDDLLTLNFTSGSTGPPKGVEITHRGMLAHIRGVHEIGMRYAHTDRTVSYLPMAHLGDRGNSHYSGMVHGFQLTCVADLARLPEVWLDTRPTIWIAVPRILEKVKASVEAGFAEEADPRRRAEVHQAMRTGLRKVRAEQAAITGTGPGPDDALLAEYADAQVRVWSGVRERLGLDQVRLAFTGAAPAMVDVLEFFAAIGLPIGEVWGMSELSGSAAMNPPGRVKFGTVGPPLPGLRVRLAEDGELLCRGEQVMRGYRGDPVKTAETLDAEGWLHTGDIAQLDADGYVRIVDRKKELIINAAGKNMSPVNIEATVKAASPLIGQAVVIGDRRPFNVALIVLDPDAGAAYAARRGLPDGSVGRLSADDTLRSEVDKAVASANDQLARAEQIKAFTILGVDWEPGGDELTPTMKLRRKPIAAKYATEIEQLYARTVR